MTTAPASQVGVPVTQAHLLRIAVHPHRPIAGPDASDGATDRGRHGKDKIFRREILVFGHWPTTDCTTNFGAMSPSFPPLTALPGVFVCGKMLDWEAPTGGYLLTGCLATGRWAGRAASRI